MISEYMNILMCTYQLLIFLVYFINNLYLCFQIPRKQKHLQKVLGIFPFSVLCLINPKQNSFLKDSHERKKYIWDLKERKRNIEKERETVESLLTIILWKIISSNKNKYCICLLFILIIFKEMFAGQEMEQCSVSSIYFARKHKFN